MHPGPHWSVADVHNGWVEAFRELGLTVVDFNYGDRLLWYEQVSLPVDGSRDAYDHALTLDEAQQLASKGIEAAMFEVWPDIVWFTAGGHIPKEIFHLARERHFTVVIHHTESPYEDDRQAVLAAEGCADLHLINDPTNLDAWREWAPNTWYVPHAYRPSLHHPYPPPPQKQDVVWVGSMWAERFMWWERFVKSAPDLSVRLAGNFTNAREHHPLLDLVVHDHDDCCDNDRAARLYSTAKVGLNIYRKSAERQELAYGWAMGPRELEMAACRLFFATEPRGENAEVLPMLPTFTTPEEAAEQARWWASHDKERDETAAAAQAAVAGRTFKNHAAKVLSHLLG